MELFRTSISIITLGSCQKVDFDYNAWLVRAIAECAPTRVPLAYEVADSLLCAHAITDEKLIVTQGVKTVTGTCG